VFEPVWKLAVSSRSNPALFSPGASFQIVRKELGLDLRAKLLADRLAVVELPRCRDDEAQ
jgi:hypothetical protein